MHVFPNSDDPRVPRPPKAIQELFSRLLEAAEQVSEEQTQETVSLHEPPKDIQEACHKIQESIVQILEGMQLRPTNALVVYVTGLISVSILQQGSGYDQPGREEQTDAIRRFATLITLIYKFNS